MCGNVLTVVFVVLSTALQIQNYIGRLKNYEKYINEMRVRKK